MDDLRLSLLLVGILVVAGVILADRLARRRRSARKAVSPPPTPVEQTAVADLDLDEGVLGPARVVDPAEAGLRGLKAERPAVFDAEAVEPAVQKPAVQPAPATPAEPAKPREPYAVENFIAVTVMARDGMFRGAELVPTLAAAGFTWSEPGVFRREDRDIGIANVLKPGQFPPPGRGLEAVETPGLLVFLRSMDPDKERSKIVLEAVASGLADHLGAELCDEMRRPLGGKRP